VGSFQRDAVAGVLDVALCLGRRTQSDFDGITVDDVHCTIAQKKFPILSDHNTGVGSVHLPLQEPVPNLTGRLVSAFVPVSNVCHEASFALRQKRDSWVGRGGFAWKHQARDAHHDHGANKKEYEEDINRHCQHRRRCDTLILQHQPLGR
jgi:hypothetical protein